MRPYSSLDHARSAVGVASVTDQIRPGVGSWLEGLAGVMVLAGSVWPGPLRRATGRGPFAMPVEAGRRVMDVWRDQLTASAESAGVSHLSVRVMVDRSVPSSLGAGVGGPLDWQMEQDPSDYRGTGGLLADLARDYPDDARLMVLHASRLPVGDWREAIGRAARLEADVAMVVDARGEPSGIQLVRCGGLRGIADVGYVDFNEQAIPAIAERGEVRVVRTPGPVTRPIRTLACYVQALREYHRTHAEAGRSRPMGPFAEDWRATFALVEAEAEVAPGAVIHDSVVLAGARVSADAVVVRSVVCPGAEVAAGEQRVDELVLGSWM